ncbi:SDR family oxidoreductase [Prolixibacter bellariivorans]|uniref:SDR family oxidoreductase n=1 Tax=Prolixibacter bellariivorans TaxID=314319 RepID=UPI000471D59A|nr:SDR family oxidoreductase [Prolixibacter bellariivorans]
MKILLTGATGYIGKRLLPVLLEQGHEVICCVRDKQRFSTIGLPSRQLSVLEIDFLNIQSVDQFPAGIDVAYYLIHSMSSSIDSFDVLEAQTAMNFRKFVEEVGVKQVIYLGGISNDQKLSKHLRSRQKVGDILAGGEYHTTILQAGIIVGSGSASFEIMRDLVEKLPFMLTPRWVLTKSQPIAIRDVIYYLTQVLLDERFFDQRFDIGGPEILTYREMMLEFAGVRGLKRYIVTVPVMTPRLSSYWLYFVTAISYNLAVNLVDSMKVEVVCKDNRLAEILKHQPVSFRDAVKLAYDRIEQNMVISSWKDAFASGRLEGSLSRHIEVPHFGCFKVVKRKKVDVSENAVMENIWSIGGDRGWYYANWLWRLRGFLDKLVGGVGLRRGRRLPNEIRTGDALDFWRVLYADKEERRLLLFAEMKLPGEAWLEFKLVRGNEHTWLYQVATFRPKGVFGRLYWYLSQPFHFFIFRGMIRRIVRFRHDSAK